MYFLFTDYYNSECVVDNPFFDHEHAVGDHICEICSEAHGLRNFVNGNNDTISADTLYTEPAILFSVRLHSCLIFSLIRSITILHYDNYACYL